MSLLRQKRRNIQTTKNCDAVRLCQATCPEKVITLKPQIDFRAARAPALVLKEEEPFCCIRCDKPFGVRSAIDRVLAKLEGKHWMYSGSSKLLDVVKMCEDCRAAFVTEEGIEPTERRLRRCARQTTIL